MSDGNSDKKPIFKKVLNAAEKAFKKLHELGTYKPEDLSKIKEYKALINETANVFKLGISQEVPEEMKAYLEKDVFIFSGLKTHAQLAEARNLLKDSEGNIRPYHLFEQDVLKLNEKYNQNYLEAEWQFAQSSSQSAANWANLSDSERYNLQYRTAGDEKVRESHAAINGTTLPKSSEFWISYYPPNGWRCRCIVVLVLASKYPATDVDKATAAAEKATTQIGKNGKNKLEMFRFNPGLEKRVFPKGNSYNPKHCDGSKLNVSGLIGLSSFVLNAENERCKAKKIIENLAELNKKRKEADKKHLDWFSEKFKKGTFDVMTGKQFENEVRISKSCIVHLLNHIADIDNKEMIRDYKTILENSEFVEKVELDASKDKKNYGKKLGRGVLYYRYYNSSWNGLDLIIHMEVMKNGYEQPYTFSIKK